MSYYEALEDGIYIKKDKYGGNWYYPTCHICGCSVPSWNYIRGNVYTCKDCKLYLALIEKQEKIRANKNGRIDKLNRAIDRISKIAKTEKYKDAINKLKGSLNDAIWFASTEEVMVALQLERKGIEYEIQKRVGPYLLDFFLPNEKVVIEVDGFFHTKDKKEKEKIRDEFIKNQTDADVIRISTDLINHNVTRIIPTFKILKKRINGQDIKQDLAEVRKWKEPTYYFYKWLEDVTGGNFIERTNNKQYKIRKEERR